LGPVAAPPAVQLLVQLSACDVVEHATPISRMSSAIPTCFERCAAPRAGAFSHSPAERHLPRRGSGWAAGRNPSDSDINRKLSGTRRPRLGRIARVSAIDKRASDSSREHVPDIRQKHRPCSASCSTLAAPADAAPGPSICSIMLSDSDTAAVRRDRPTTLSLPFRSQRNANTCRTQRYM